MNIIEVKNNLVRFSYEEDLRLSDLIKINDTTKSYIAQILHLESTRTGKSAVARIIFNYDGQIRSYDGSIPSLRAESEVFDTNTLLKSVKCESPLVIGKISGQKENLTVDFDILNDNPIIISEKMYTTKFLLNNIALQLNARNKKLVVFDTTGVFKANRLTLAKDFKLPLNHSAINYIYDKEFADATDESKAFIQSIFEELSEYSKTVDFIPFDTFKSVIDDEFVRTKLIQLVVMKNKLKQLRDKGIFAQTANEFEVLKSKLSTENTVIINISGFSDYIQQECIKYVYTLLKELGQEFYSFTPIPPEATEKEFINDIFSVENVHTTIICDYNYSNLSELKKVSKNMMMFTPIKQQKDFGGYNIFLQKLAEDEFIAYGKMTKFVPLIGKLVQISSDDIYIPKESKPVEVQPEPEVKEENTDSQEIITTEENPVEAETIRKEPNKTEEIIENTIIQPLEEQEANIVEPITEIQNTEPSQENIISDEEPVVEAFETPQTEEITAPQPQTIEVPETEVLKMAGSTAETVKLPEISQEPAKETVVQNEVQEALAQVPDIEDDEELSDDDLDMIEKLSKPNEEIPVLNESEPQPEVAIPEIPVQTEEEPSTPEITPEEPEQTEQTIVEEPPQPIEEEEIPTPPETEPLQTRASTTPTMPEYSAEIPEEDKVNSDAIGQGDRVYHEEFGEGVVEKMINYGDKLLCSINFASVGRRLLNPDISEMRKI